MLYRIYSLGAAFLVLSFISGCSTPQPEFSGFLENYQGFESVPGDEDVLMYRKPGVDLSVLDRYDRVLIDPVVVWYKNDSPYKGLHPEMLARLADEFHQAMIEALQGRYHLVLLPGPGVLRIRTAITNLQVTRPARDTATYVSSERPISILSMAVTDRHILLDQATIEAELLDSQTNQRLFAYVDRRIGDKVDPVQRVANWGHITATFNHWAREFRTRLGEVGQQVAGP